MQLPDPSGMELNDWADAVVYVTSQYADVSPLYGDDWQSWGMFFFNSPQLGNVHAPDPYGFTDWREWASRLAESLLNARGSASTLIAKAGP